ncbi:hypothetical protein F5I97DRAFT_538750 [Phlebopus sp. FC_14]|nr:hypothetical protein F5I97DRAFT_538750 [Phlebopus sp. FC_14]
MLTQAPAWRKRTRPCPFYSQGRCLFADSCNFLHDIKVKSAADQSVLDATYAKPKIPSPSENVLNPPSLVVNSPTSPSANLSGQTCNSSRYSGLLSVLQDVIGPIVDVEGNNVATSYHEGPHHPPLDIQDSTYNGNSLLQGWDEALLDANPNGIDADRCVSPVIGPAVETTHQGDVGDMAGLAVLAVVQSPLSEPLPLPNNLKQDREPAFPSSFEEDEHLSTTFISYLVEDDAHAEDHTGIVESETHVLPSNDVDAVEDSDPAMTPSPRDSQVTFVVPPWSGDGASLLASPQDTPLRSFPIRNSIQACSPNMLSPVQLSARLRPFSIHTLDISLKRGTSIDSGYADGEGWINPFPFSRSPPRSVRSSTGSITFPSRGSSLVLPAMQEKRVSYDVRPVRPSPGMSIVAIEENTSDNTSGEGEEADACSVFGADDLSPSENQEDSDIDCRSPTLRISAMQTAGCRLGAGDELEPPFSPASRLASQPAHGTDRSSVVGVAAQYSIVSDDKSSFNTARSPQCSFEDLSDVSAGVSPVRQDSLLSFISGRSSPNTSVLSPDSDAPKLLGEDVNNLSLHDISDLPNRPSSTSLENGMDRQEDISEGTWSTNLPSLPTSASEVVEELGQHSPGAADTEQTQTVCVDFTEDASFGGDPEPDAREDPGADKDLSSEEDPNSFDSEYYSFLAASPSRFPLPPTHLPTGLARDVKSYTDEGTYVSSITQDSDAHDNLARKWATSQRTGYNVRRTGADSGPTIRAEPDTSLIGVCESSGLKAKFFPRGRAASDITVKGLPVRSARPEEEFANPASASEVDVPLPEGERDWSDSVQSLYDHYLDLDDGPPDCRPSTPDSGNEDLFTSHSPLPGQYMKAHRSDGETDYLLASDSATDVQPMLSAPVPVDSSTDCSRPRTIFRPLLTGRRSILDPSFPVDFITQLNSAERSPALSSTSSVRLPSKEIGSTMVPLGFRRYNSQFAAKHSLHSIPKAPHSAPPLAEPREALCIRTDSTEQVSLPRCFSAEPASPKTSLPFELEPRQSQFVPQSGGLKPLRLVSPLLIL